MAVLILAGDDDLLLAREVDRRLADLEREDPDLVVDRFDVIELEQLPELRTTSLFGGRTCVVLRGVEGVTEPLKGELERYLDAPSEDAHLVLVARGTAKIQRIARQAKAAGQRWDVKRPPEWEDKGWERIVGEEFRRLGRKADATAIAAVRLHAGTEPATIASQVGSVCATHAEVPVITGEHVESVLRGHGRASGFVVADAVAARDPRAALVALSGALGAGEAPLAIAGALNYRIRQLLQLRSGTSPGELKLRGKRADEARAQARAFGPGELAWAHDRLATLDLQLKGAELPDALLLEVAVLELATPRAVGAPFNPLASRPG